jgi:hypothetical protein
MASNPQAPAGEILQFVAVTSGGQGFDIAFPLHPETGSAEAVSDLVTDLLATISRHADGRSEISSGDVLQALAMVSAIRGRMLDADTQTIEGLARQLQDAAWRAVSAAEPFATGRA